MSYHTTERCFRRYEKYITRALEIYPNSIRFKTHRSASTDAARCRDAITHYRKRKWKVESEVYSKLEDPNVNLTTWIDDNEFVVIGDGNLRHLTPDQALKINEVEVVDSLGTDQFGSVPFNATTEDHIGAIITLIDDGVITFPVSVPKEWGTIAQLLALDKLNVAVRLDETRTIIF